MRCQQCAQTVAGALRAVGGVCEAEVDLERARARIGFDEAQTGIGQLIAAVRSCGYEAKGYWLESA